MITPGQLEDLLRLLEQRRQIKRSPPMQFTCVCGRIHTRIVDLYICSESHTEC